VILSAIGVVNCRYVSAIKTPSGVNPCPRLKRLHRAYECLIVKRIAYCRAAWLQVARVRVRRVRNDARPSDLSTDFRGMENRASVICGSCIRSIECRNPLSVRRYSGALPFRIGDGRYEA
jgi:hypothetical protein